ncbi:MAG: ankyrin repeat domain-containing protein [Selenomonas sp.]|nr:ankyrin repeat domain-containing protein [Selenomonas sp.]
MTTDIVIVPVERQLARMQAEGKDLPARAQDVNGSTYYSRASLDFGHICLDCRQTAAHIAAQVRAVTFRVYQLPSFEGVPIRFCHILRARSQAKPGQILRRTENGFLLSSVDYDVVLFVDQFASLMAYVAQNNPSGLQRIPYWQAYLQDFETEHGRTPLMVAAAHGYVELAMQLIEAGADIHARDYMGASLLFYAMRGYGINGDDRLLAYLQDHGLSMIDENYEGQSVQKICQAHGNKLLNSISSSCTGGVNVLQWWTREVVHRWNEAIRDSGFHYCKRQSLTVSFCF